MIKIPVAVLAATGSVGQRFVQLLDNHPWFEVVALTGSERGYGKTYAEVCRWLLPGGCPPGRVTCPCWPLTPMISRCRWPSPVCRMTWRRMLSPPSRAPVQPSVPTPPLTGANPMYPSSYRKLTRSMPISSRSNAQTAGGAG